MGFSAGIYYGRYVLIEKAADEQLKPFAPVILSGLLKLITEISSSQGISILFSGVWTTEESEKQELILFSLQALGSLSLRAPELYCKDLSIVTKLTEILLQVELVYFF